jgi:hypothetical protein
MLVASSWRSKELPRTRDGLRELCEMERLFGWPAAMEAGDTFRRSLFDEQGHLPCLPVGSHTSRAAYGRCRLDHAPAFFYSRLG